MGKVVGFKTTANDLFVPREMTLLWSNSGKGPREIPGFSGVCIPVNPCFFVKCRLSAVVGVKK